MTTAKSASSRAWTAATSASSALPRAVDVREMAMSAFCKAILEALCAALTAASIRSRNLADRIKNRCFFFCDVISTLFLYLPSSFVPSCVQQSENHERWNGIIHRWHRSWTRINRGAWSSIHDENRRMTSKNILTVSRLTFRKVGCTSPSPYSPPTRRNKSRWLGRGSRSPGPNDPRDRNGSLSRDSKLLFSLLSPEFLWGWTTRTICLFGCVNYDPFHLPLLLV